MRCPCKRGHASAELMKHEEPPDRWGTGSMDCVPHLGLFPASSFLRLSKAEHPVEGLACPLVWQRSHRFIVLEEFQAHRTVSAVEKCPALQPGLCCVLVSWSGDPPGREGSTFAELLSKHEGLALLSPLPSLWQS